MRNIEEKYFLLPFSYLDVVRFYKGKDAYENRV